MCRYFSELHQFSSTIRVGEVPGSNPGAPIFPCKSTTFLAPICGVPVTAEAERDVPRGGLRLAKVLQIGKIDRDRGHNRPDRCVYLTGRAQAGG